MAYKQIHYFCNKKGNRTISYAVGDVTYVCPINGLQLEEYTNISPRQYIYGLKNMEDLTPKKTKQDILEEKFHALIRTRFKNAIEINSKIRAGTNKFIAIYEELSKIETLPFCANDIK